MPRRKRTDPDHPVFESLTTRERTALMRDYARECAATPSTIVTEMVKRSGPAVFAAVWISNYRSHQGKRRRARWPDEEHPPETAAEVRARKRAARERKASQAA